MAATVVAAGGVVATVAAAGPARAAADAAALKWGGKGAVAGEDADADEIKEWEILDNLEENIQSGKYRIPDFIKLVFQWEEENLERTITLPIKRISPSGLAEEPY